MDLYGKFKFHGVGQGLFYTGDIFFENENNKKSFHFIYDCGSTSSREKEDLMVSIVKYLKDKERIDMIVLSHFHEDHINGLEHLAKIVNQKKIKIKRIFIPYFYPEEILILMAIAQTEEEWYYRFLMAPVSYLSETFGENLSEIVIVTTENNDENEDNKTDNPPDPDNPSDQETENLDEDRLKSQNVKVDVRSYGNSVNGNIKVTTIDGRRIYVYNDRWIFKFFSYRGKNSLKNLRIKLGSCIRKHEGNRSFFDCIEKEIYNMSCVDLIVNNRKIINRCFKSLINNRLKVLKDINNTSLVLYHSPSKKLRKMYTETLFSYFCRDDKFCYRTHFKPICFGFYNCCGTFLTGDISLKDDNIFEKFRNHYSKYISKFCVFQVPHHGSGHNWTKGNSKIHKACKHFVISHGLGNKYGHPSIEVVRDILFSDGYPILVNELWEFEYIIEVYR